MSMASDTTDPAIRARCREKIGAFTVDRAAEGIAKAYRSVIGEAE